MLSFAMVMVRWRHNYMWRRDINPRRYALITRISHVPVTIVGRGWDWVCIDRRLGGKWGSMCMEVSEGVVACE